MKKQAKIILIISIIVIFYILIINFVAYLMLMKPLKIYYEYGGNRVSGTMMDIKIHSSIDILVERNRWYGKIIEDVEKSHLYLFKIPFVRLPLKINGNRFIGPHLSFLFLLMIITYSLIKFTKEVK